jgi:negative regulator of flagellin synthesis FlgM
VNVNDSINSTSLTDVTQPQARTPSAPAAAPAKPDASATAAATATANNSAANVQLSSQYQALGVKSNSADSFDAKKVAEIKEAIANGTFQVDPDKVADGVLNTAKDLVSTRQY